MFRLTRKVFHDLAIWMAGFGAATGLLFPFFAWAMGLPRENVLTPGFFGACILAGVAVGAANIGLARSVVGIRLRVLASRMQQVEQNLRQVARNGDTSECSAENCLVSIDSDDDFGNSAQAFNRLVQTLDSSFRSERAVREFNELLTGELDLELLAAEALQQLMKHTSCAAGAVLLNNEGEIKLCTSFGINDPQRIVDSDLVHWTLKKGKRQLVSFSTDVIMDGVLASFRPREILVEPIVFSGVPLCAILLASASGFSHDDKVHLDLLHRGLALSFHNAVLFDRLEHLAALDAHTGLYNRRFGLSRLQEEFSRAVRTGSPLGLLMFDIDHFKKVNDTYGHLVGDRVIKQIAHIVRSVAREGDVSMRYGGEEFLMVLPGASVDDAAKVAERLRREVEVSHVIAGAKSICVTVSVGVVSFPDCLASDETDCVRIADEALYAAKAGGRNRVIVHAQDRDRVRSSLGEDLASVG
jgi:two-component system cell cycle response regulator